MFLWIAASVVDAAAVNPNGIKILLVNGLSTSPIKDNLICNLLFYAITFLKVLHQLINHMQKLCVLLNNNLCGKLFSSLASPAIFDERFKVTLVPYFIADFNLLGCELDSFIFNKLYWIIFYILEKHKSRILLQLLVKNLKLFL